MIITITEGASVMIEYITGIRIRCKLHSVDRLSTLVARSKCHYQQDYLHSNLSARSSTGRQIVCGQQIVNTVKL